MPQYYCAITDYWQLSFMWTIFPDMGINVAVEAVSLMQLLTLVTFLLKTYLCLSLHYVIGSLTF